MTEDCLIFIGNDGQRVISFLQFGDNFFMDHQKDRMVLMPLTRVVEYVEMSNGEIELTLGDGGKLSFGYPNNKKPLLDKFLTGIKETFKRNKGRWGIRITLFPHNEKRNVVIINFNNQIKIPTPKKTEQTREIEISPELHVIQTMEKPTFWNKLTGFEKVTEIEGKNMAIKEFNISNEGKKTIYQILNANLEKD